MAVVTPTSAQTFGRWSWRARVGVEQWGTENLSNGSKLSNYGRLGLRASGNLDGFIIHPTIAGFSLLLDTFLSNYDNGVLDSNDAIGGGVSFQVLPRSATPMRFGFRRRLFGYELPTDGDPTTLFIRPDRTTEWRGQINIRKGLLSGLLVSYDRTNTDFLDPEASTGIHEQNLIQWGLTTGKVRHEIKLRRRYDLYGVTDFEREDLSLYIDERNLNAETWNWMLTGSGIFRDAERDGRQSSLDQYRIFGKTFRELRAADRLELDVQGTSERLNEEDRSLVYAVTSTYRWFPRASLQVSPFLRYVAQERGPSSIRSPRIGASVIWTRRRRAYRSVLGFTVNTGQVTASGAGQSNTDRDTSFSLTETFVYGDPRRFQADFELGLFHNELDLRRSSAPGLEPPDLVESFGRDDAARLRTRLRKLWGPRSLSFWLDLQYRRSSGDLRPIPFTSNTLSGNFQLSQNRLTAVASIGQTSLDREDGNDQDLRFGTASLNWRPLYYLQLSAFYRANRQSLLFAPALDTQSFEVRARLEIGLLLVEGRVYQASEEFIDSPQRTNRGFSWSISRRFGGWLPIVSAPKRRGTIR